MSIREILLYEGVKFRDQPENMGIKASRPKRGGPFSKGKRKGKGFYIIDNPLGKGGRPASAVKPIFIYTFVIVFLNLSFF